MSTKSHHPVTAGAEPISPAAVLGALDEVTAGASFVKAERPARFLRHLVETTLRGETHRLKESVLGVEFFGRPVSWDPRLDGIVRQEAARLRKRLFRHYETGGASATVRIDLPVGGYVPVFVSCPETAQPPAIENLPRNPLKAPEAARRPVQKRRWVFGAALILCAATSAAGWRYWRDILAARLGNQSSIAVLPFANLSPDPANQYFADGLTDEITDLLARNRTLRVSARSSASQFSAKSGVEDIGSKLRVANVLEGSVDRSGDRIRIIAHLERVSDGSHIWSNTYERRTEDLFSVQSELAAAIAGNLKAAAGLPAAPRHVPSAEAHEFYMKGRYEVQQMTSDSLDHAEADFHRAIDLDPSYAAAYAWLGTTKFDRAGVGMRAGTDAERQAVEQAYRKALELDPDQPGVHGRLASEAMQFDWDWNGAERELRQALNGAPDATANTWYACFLAFHGRFAEADPYLQRAQELDPFGSATLNNIALVRYLAGRYADARDTSQKLLSVAPGMLAPQLVIGLTHIAEGQPEMALPELQKLAQRFPPAQVYVAMARARAGQREEALRLIRPFEEKYPHPGIPLQWFALVYGWMGDQPNTMKWLARSADAREWQALNLAVHPAFVPMRKLPEFRALEKRMGLE